MRATILLAAVWSGLVCTAPSRAAETVSPDIFQARVEVNFPALSDNVQNVLVVTTPTNKRLVIQTVSFYRAGGSNGSTVNLFLGTQIFNNLTFWAMPEVAVFSGGPPYAAATLSATFYAGAGSPVVINGYRTGDTTYAETVYVSVSGYYVAKP